MNTRVFVKNSWIGDDLVFEVINGIYHASYNTKIGYALTIQSFNPKKGIELPDGKFYIVRSKNKQGYTTSHKNMLLIESRDKARDMRFKHIETLWKVAVDSKGKMFFLKKNP